MQSNDGKLKQAETQGNLGVIQLRIKTDKTATDNETDRCWDEGKRDYNRAECNADAYQ